MQANLRRRTRACSDSAISDMAAVTALSDQSCGRTRNVSDAVPSAASGGGGGGGGGDDARYLSPVGCPFRRGLSTPPRSPSLGSDMATGGPSFSPRGDKRMSLSEHRSPSQVPSEGWSDWGLGDSWDELHDPRATPPRGGAATAAGNSSATPSSPPRFAARRRTTMFSPSIPAWARDRLRAASSLSIVAPEMAERGTDELCAPGGGVAGVVGRGIPSSLRFDVWRGNEARQRGVGAAPLSIGVGDAGLPLNELGLEELHETE